jgi:hypothetical protein
MTGNTHPAMDVNSDSPVTGGARRSPTIAFIAIYVAVFGFLPIINVGPIYAAIATDPS